MRVASKSPFYHESAFQGALGRFADERTFGRRHAQAAQVAKDVACERSAKAILQVGPAYVTANCSSQVASNWLPRWPVSPPCRMSPFRSSLQTTCEHWWRGSAGLGRHFCQPSETRSSAARGSCRPPNMTRVFTARS